MIIGIFADVHDHLDHLRRAVEVFNEAECELVLFAGDLVSTFVVPVLRPLNCPLIGCFGDNEGNKPGLLAGTSIIGQLGEGPLGVRSADGTRFLIAHMRRQLRGLADGADVLVYAHTHRPKIDRDDAGRLHINPGETSGWTFGRPTVALLDTSCQSAWLVDLAPCHPRQPALSDPGSL